jgi:lipid A ethanolaminephosphotransferase
MASCLWVFVTGVIPAMLLAFVKIEYKTFKKEFKVRMLSFALCIAVVGFFALTSYKEYVSFGRNNRQAQKLINTFNYIYATFRYFNIKAQANREFVTLDDNPVLSPHKDPLATVIIFIVGETARAKSFSLGGYERETNPLLSKQDIIFNKAVSCGTATAVSVPCLFSNLNRSNFDKNSAKYTENFLDIAQKSGYRVVWRENDGGCKDVCNRVESEDMVRINNPKYCRDGFCQDEVLLDGLEEMLAGVKNNTIIALHTMGSHGPTYFERYPERFRVFTPTCDTAEIQNCPQEAIVNTYDNTIVYTDFIISSAIDILKKFPNFESGLIYISDHGESLGENNIYLHGLPYMIAPKEQTEIPMVIWMSENMKKYDHIDYECLRKEASNNSFSQDNIFHTMMGWLEIDTKVYDEKYDIFNSCRTKSLPSMEKKR